MNSKEALEFIIKTFNELAQKPQDIGLFFNFCEAHGKVKQDLDRLEELEKENQGLRISLEKCGTHIEVIEKELRRLENENQTLKERLYKVQYLEKENSKLFGENQKLKHAVEILKERGGINLFINRNSNNKLTLDFDDCISCVLEPKEYVLLKEVLKHE